MTKQELCTAGDTSKHVELVTIGVPTRNGAKTIRRALDSVLAQSYSRWELVISDNASSDETQAICSSYADTEPRVRYVRQARNIGMAANFNATLKHARGKYFAWLSDDDAWSPHYLECLVDSIRGAQRPALAACRYRYVYENGEYIDSSDVDETWSTLQSTIYYMRHGEINWFYGLFATNVLRACGGMHRDWRPFLQLSDYLTVLKVMLRGDVRVVNRVLVYKAVRDLHRYRFKRLARWDFDPAFWRAVVRYLTMPIGLWCDLACSAPWIMWSEYAWAEKARLMGEAVRVWGRGNQILFSDISHGLRCFVRRRE